MQDRTVRPPRCPWWCNAETEHADEYTEERRTTDPVTLVRSHARSFGDVFVLQDEENLEGAVTLLPPLIFASNDEFRDPAAARQMARDVDQAADLLYQILSSAERAR